MLYNKYTFYFLGLIFLNNLSYSQNRDIKIVYNGDALRGDNGPIPVYNGPPPQMDYSPKKPIVTNNINNIIISYSELDPNFRTYYNLQSNACIHYIVQDPAHPLDFHAIFMTATIPNTWDDRNARYSFSSNGGVTWTYLGTVGQTRSGFPWLSIMTSGNALISTHNTDAGGQITGHLYVDAGEGIGSFSRLDPQSGIGLGNIWMVCQGTLNRAFVTASVNGQDSVSINTVTSLTPPGTWLGWYPIHISNTSPATAQQYSEAAGDDGRWGVAFCTKNGGAAITESTNQGVSWSTPAIIWAYRASDSLGTLRSIDLVYEGVAPSHPRVLLGLGNTDPVGGNFNPGRPSKEVFWGPDINGGNVITVDSAGGLNGTNTTNDVFFSVCRGVIGKASDGSALFAAYARARQDTSNAGNNYFDTYLKYSSDHGLTWSSGIQLTNLPGQENVLCDYRWASISPSNVTSGNTHNVYLEVSRDSVPGSAVNGAPASIMRAEFIKVVITPTNGIHNISSNIPSHFSLSQNYPNPFNPSTIIKFDIRPPLIPLLGKEGTGVILKIYNTLGKEIATLVNQQLKPGSYEVTFDGTNFPSGVYFYKFEAKSEVNEFIDSKKMIILK